MKFHRDAAGLWWAPGDWDGKWYRRSSSSLTLKAPRLGSEWIWMAHKPEAVCRVKVTEIVRDAQGKPRVVRTEILERGRKAAHNAPGGTFGNDISRFWEAVSPALTIQGLEPELRDLTEDDVGE